MASSENLIDDQIDKKEGEMSFFDHLEELRWRLIYAIIGIIIGTIITWIFIDQLVNFILLKPARDAGAELQNLKPFGQIFLFVQVAIVAGIVLSIPNTFYQLWKFISPALKNAEKKICVFNCIFFNGVFLIGLGFCIFYFTAASNGIRNRVWC